MLTPLITRTAVRFQGKDSPQSTPAKAKATGSVPDLIEPGTVFQKPTNTLPTEDEISSKFQNRKPRGLSHLRLRTQSRDSWTQIGRDGKSAVVYSARGLYHDTKYGFTASKNAFLRRKKPNIVSSNDAERTIEHTPTLRLRENAVPIVGIAYLASGGLGSWIKSQKSGPSRATDIAQWGNNAAWLGTTMTNAPAMVALRNGVGRVGKLGWKHTGGRLSRIRTTTQIPASRGMSTATTAPGERFSHEV